MRLYKQLLPLIEIQLQLLNLLRIGCVDSVYSQIKDRAALIHHALHTADVYHTEYTL